MKAAKNLEMISDLRLEQKEMEATPNEQVLLLFRNMARAYAENTFKNGSTKAKRKKAS